MSKTLGQIACEAWSTSHTAHHEHHDPARLVGWADLREVDRLDWEAAAAAVMREGCDDAVGSEVAQVRRPPEG